MTAGYSSVDVSFQQVVSNFSTDGEGNPLFSFESVPAVIYNVLQQKETQLHRPDITTEGTFSGVVHRVYTDRNKNKWLCTTEGLYIMRHTTSPISVFNLDNHKDGFPAAIYAVAKGKNALWLQDRGTLRKFDYRKQKMGEQLAYSGKLLGILLDAGDSVLWIAGKKEVVLFNFNRNKIIKKIQLHGDPYFAVSIQKNIWVGTWDDGLYEIDNNAEIINHYTDKDGLANNNLICGWYDGRNELWLGMNGGHGFALFDIAEKKFKNFVISSGTNNLPETNSLLETNSVTAVINDKTGSLWLGTYGGGIYHFNRKENEFQNYQQSEGLSGNYINTLSFDSKGNLWISTMNGVDIMDVNKKNFHHVTEKIEQQNNDHIRNLVVTEEGTFFYTGRNKIVGIEPLKYIQSFPEANILKTAFKIYDREMPALLYDSIITLSYNQNFFNAEFSVIKTSPDIPALYRYKLKGFDKDWNEAGNRGVANYTNVPPGSYTLLLNATNEAGKWNEHPLAMVIIIDPPFWRTWWFYTLVLLASAALLIYVVRNRITRLKERQMGKMRLVVATQEIEKKNIAAELHDDLGVRLSALKYFVASLKNHLTPGDKQALETYTKTITIIDESVEDVRYLLINLSPKTLNEYGYLTAVEDLVNKLSHLHIIDINLKQNGMEQRLDADVEAGLYRITQELINNTLKHADAGVINLSIERTGGILQLKYSDDGKGFDAGKKSKGYGIENIHTRVALLNGKIEWGGGIQKSTNALISIPYSHT